MPSSTIPSARMSHYTAGMDRRTFLGTIGLGVLAAPIAADAQQASNPRRVGVFPPGSSSGSDQFQALVKAFRDGLRDLKWIEGHNVVLEVRWGEGRIGDFSTIASQLVGLSVDVIV